MEPDATEINKAAEVLHAMAVEDLNVARAQLGMQYRLTGGDVPNPDSQAVRLLREMVAAEPYCDENSDYHASCVYCHSVSGHKTDCLYAKAQAFIAALDVK